MKASFAADRHVFGRAGTRPGRPGRRSEQDAAGSEPDFRFCRPLKGQAGMVDWRLNGSLSELILKDRFDGKRGEALLMPLNGRLPAKELLVLGLGNQTLQSSGVEYLRI